MFTIQSSYLNEPAYWTGNGFSKHKENAQIFHHIKFAEFELRGMRQYDTPLRANAKIVED